MLPTQSPAWEMSDMSDVDELRGRALYDALMVLKPDGLAATDWAVKAGLNRGFFTNQKSGSSSPHSTNLKKLLDYIGRTESDLYAAAAGTWKKPKLSDDRGSRPQFPDRESAKSVDGGEPVLIIQHDLSLAMGPGTFIDDFVESEPVVFDAAVLRRLTRAPFERLRVVTGVGNSHEPVFQSSDQFLIDLNDRQLGRLDGYYWITYEGAHALKRLQPAGAGRVKIISENPGPRFDPIEVDAADLRIEGRAIWFSRGL